MTILWWHWLVLGLLLLVAEAAAAGGFYIVFFGVGALAVGALTRLGVLSTLPWQATVFVTVSVLSLGLFRSRLLRLFQRDPQSPAIDALVGEIGVAHDGLAPGAMGRVELRGTPWSARNLAAEPLARGARCRVIGVDGLTLHVEPERSR